MQPAQQAFTTKLLRGEVWVAACVADSTLSLHNGA